MAEPGAGTQAGLVLFYDRKNLVGATTDGRDFFVCYPDGFVRREPNPLGKSVCLRIVNESNSLSLYASGKNGKIIKLMDNVDVSAMYPGGGDSVDLTPCLDAIYDAERARLERDQADERLKAAQAIIKQYMGDAEIGTADDRSVSWKSQTRRTFDAKAFAAAHPEIDLDPFYRESTSRVFKIKN